MSTYKTRVVGADVERFLREHLQDPSITLTTIADGEVSQAYSFESAGEGRILRVSRHGDGGFIKDRLAHRHYGSAGVPIPAILTIGELEPGLCFAISEQVPGVTLDSASDLDATVPQIIEMLDRLHALAPVGEGFGQWDASLQGAHATWRESLLASLDLDDDETRGAKFYDTTLHDELRAEVLGLIDACPEERRLVHADFGFNNVLIDGGTITGVIDWEMSMYGDRLYDVAWLDFWAHEQRFGARFKQHYSGARSVPECYDERLRTYLLQIGLGALGFFARSRQGEKYEFAREVVARIRVA